MLDTARIENVWNDYAECWSATEPERREALGRCVVESVTYRDPQQEAKGIDALARTMESFATQFSGHRFRISSVATHHGRSLARWCLVAESGSVKMSGTSAASHADDGRLFEIAGFFETGRGTPSRVAMITTSHAEFGETGKTTGFWFEELAGPYWAFVDGGCEVVLASPRGGASPTDPMSLSEAYVTPAVRRFRADAEAMRRLASTRRLEELRGESFDAVFLVGGHGTMWDFPDDAALGALLDRVTNEEGVIAAVCHGTAGLLAAPSGTRDRILRDRALTGFSNAEESMAGATSVVPFLLEARLREAGARYSAGAPFGVHVVREERLVTGQNPASSGPCARVVLSALAERAVGASI